MMNAIALGAVLGVIGVTGYLATQRKSLTALIPLLFGAVLVGLGLAGEAGGSLQTVALAVALLGFVATARGLRTVLGAASESNAPRAAALAKAAMALACLVFLVVELAGPT